MEHLDTIYNLCLKCLFGLVLHSTSSICFDSGKMKFHWKNRQMNCIFFHVMCAWVSEQLNLMIFLWKKIGKKRLKLILWSIKLQWKKHKSYVKKPNLIFSARSDLIFWIYTSLLSQIEPVVTRNMYSSSEINKKSFP